MKRWWTFFFALLAASVLANAPHARTLPIQERDTNNNVLVTYTRGLDLSGTLQGAGGIGGLLARTDGNGSTFYHADGNGNVTVLIDGYQNVVARYLYSPFGKQTGQWGALANANVMRFSSMPVHRITGISHYAYRDYDPNPQEFLTSDPIGEAGGIPLHGFVGNSPVNLVDPDGLFFKQWFSDLGNWLYNKMMGDRSGSYDPNGQLAQRAAMLGNEGADTLQKSMEGVVGNGGDLATDYLAGEGAGKLLGAGIGVICKSVAKTGLMNPNTIRFSQDSIKAAFKDPSFGTIDDLAAGLKNGSIKPNSIEPIRLVEQNGNLISIDNRRLEAFRRAGVDVPTRMATPAEIQQAIQQGKFSAGELGGSTIKVRGQ